MEETSGVSKQLHIPEDAVNSIVAATEEFSKHCLSQSHSVSKRYDLLDRVHSVPGLLLGTGTSML